MLLNLCFFTRAFGEQTDSAVHLINLKIINKCLYGQIDLNVYDFASFVTHNRTSLSNSFNLKPLYAKPLHFKLQILKVGFPVSIDEPFANNI